MNGARVTMAVAGLLVASGCKTLDRFEPGPDETYCGDLVGSPLFHDGVLPEGVPQRMQMRVDLDVDSLTDRPARLSTDDGATGLCSTGGAPLFSDTPMRAIRELSHDALSTMDLGDGYDLNVLGWADSSCQGTFLVVLSLMHDNSLELRLLKPASLPAADAGPESRPGFALFPLQRTKRDRCAL